MQIDLSRISTDFCGERCYVHARGLMQIGRASCRERVSVRV